MEEESFNQVILDENEDYTQQTTDNRFSVLGSREVNDNASNTDTDFSSNFIEVKQNKKRTRTSTESYSNSNISLNVPNSARFESLAVDDKLSVMYSEMNSQYKSIEQKVDSCLKIMEKVDHIEERMNDHEIRLKYLEYKTIDLEARSRRNNLLLGGVAESRNEDCRSLVKCFFKDRLGLDPCPEITRCHRLGRFRQGQTRPIIMNLLDYRDTELILTNAHKLKNTNFHLNRDYPREIVNARKALWRHFKAARQDFPDRKVSIAFPAKLVVGGKVVEDMFPHWDKVMSTQHSMAALPQQNQRRFDLPIQTPVLSQDTNNFKESTKVHSSSATVSDDGKQSHSLSQNSMNIDHNDSRDQINTSSAREHRPRQRGLDHTKRRSPRQRSRAPARRSSSLPVSPPVFTRPWAANPNNQTSVH